MSTLGLGAELFYGTAGATASTQIARVRSITPPGPEVPVIDRSTLESTAREKLAGLPDFGEAEVTIEHVEATAETLYGMIGEQHSWRVRLANGFEYEWDGFITNVPTEGVAIDELVVHTLNIAVDGEMTATAGT